MLPFPSPAEVGLDHFETDRAPQPRQLQRSSGTSAHPNPGFERLQPTRAPPAKMRELARMGHLRVPPRKRLYAPLSVSIATILIARPGNRHPSAGGRIKEHFAGLALHMAIKIEHVVQRAGNRVE